MNAYNDKSTPRLTQHTRILYPELKGWNCARTAQNSDKKSRTCTLGFMICESNIMQNLSWGIYMEATKRK